MRILDSEFYQHPDVLFLAKQLLGKWLMSKINDAVTGGMIIETEAYQGTKDRACHAFNNRRTKRTEVMYQKGGVAYVYLCYGMHNLFNVVTNKRETPHAVLIRALNPTCGIEIMQQRRQIRQSTKLTSGPGMICQALGIDQRHNGHKLTKSPVWIEDRNIVIEEKKILKTPRVNVAYAKKHALLPWRFRIST